MEINYFLIIPFTFSFHSFRLALNYSIISIPFRDFTSHYCRRSVECHSLENYNKNYTHLHFNSIHILFKAILVMVLRKLFSLSRVLKKINFSYLKKLVFSTPSSWKRNRWRHWWWICLLDIFIHLETCEKGWICREEFVKIDECCVATVVCKNYVFPRTLFTRVDSTF
jgi:hypothetical protein